jgi:hypothetical protein
VLVHNGTEATDDAELPYLTLRPGDEFDLRERRRIISPDNSKATTEHTKIYEKEVERKTNTDRRNPSHGWTLIYTDY